MTEPSESLQREIMVRDRVFVLSPGFAQLIRFAHREGLLPAILRAANLDLSEEIPPLESRAWLPRFPEYQK
jgi:hypothetical protein